MKILYHHRTQRHGVEGVHIAGVINALRELGHEVIEVALVTGSASSEVKRTEKDNTLKKILCWIAEHVPNSFFRVLEILYNLIAFWKVARVLSCEKIDYIYERYACFAFASIILQRIYKIPLLLEVNVTTDLPDTRKMELYSIGAYIETKVLQSADAIFTVSDYLRECIVARGIDANKVFVQPNAFTVKEVKVESGSIMSDSAKKNAEGKTIICFLGRLLPWYCLDRLIEIFHLIHGKFPKTFLLIIGDGSERNSLGNMVEKYGLVESVMFSGSVTHDEALALLIICDICVIPSTNPWTSPVKLFEYMGMGKPVVAPDIEAVTSIMKDGVHGRVFPLDDFNEFRKKIEYLIENPEIREKMGLEAKDHIRKNHTWMSTAKKVMAVASDLLSKRR